MNFRGSFHPVALDMELIPSLLERTRELYERTQCPEGRPGCTNCRLLDSLNEVTG
jgi:hypothetical protein